MNVLTAFKERILQDLLPEYCDDPSRAWGPDGVRPDWSKVTEVDAADFLRGLDGGLVRHVGRGQYVAPRSASKEQFFWEGSKSVVPRPISLWLEPIITVAALARLHFDHGWPMGLIGAQSADWAFDVVAYREEGATAEQLACEVKTSTAEVDRMVVLMREFARAGVRSEADVPKRGLNAFRKLQGLRARRAPVFWALGPGGVGQVFQVVYGEGDAVTFQPCAEDVLTFDPPAAAANG